MVTRELVTRLLLRGGFKIGIGTSGLRGAEVETPMGNFCP